MERRESGYADRLYVLSLSLSLSVCVCILGADKVGQVSQTAAGGAGTRPRVGEGDARDAYWNCGTACDC